MTMAALCMQSAVLGFGVFRVLERYGITSGLSIGENVILQTTSVATATMPLAAGKPSVVFIVTRQNPSRAQQKCCAIPVPSACLLERMLRTLKVHHSISLIRRLLWSRAASPKIVGLHDVPQVPVYSQAE